MPRVKATRILKQGEKQGAIPILFGMILAWGGNQGQTLNVECKRIYFLLSRFDPKLTLSRFDPNLTLQPDRGRIVREKGG